ncbi:MAG: ABC transporter permease [Bifidobacteriaceae bacterium]|jgi:ABC-2 type transport system permease protein|nr:ABC transporter permease [Bifidobacteriaceae bacterium]
MTATAIPATGRQYQSSLGQDLTLGGIVKSEWIKLRSLRSTWWCAVLLILLSFGFGVPIAAVEADQWESVVGPGGGSDFTLLLTNNGLTMLGQMVAVVIGALIVTGEYGSGSIRSTLAAAPRRGQVFAAKVTVAAVFTAVVAVIAMAATAAGIVAVLAANGKGNGFGPDAAALAFGGVYYLVASALIGVGLGFILRSSAGAIASGIGLLFVAPMVLALGSSNEFVSRVVDLTPWQAGALMATSPGFEGSLLGGYWGGAACLAAWVLLALVPAYAVFQRRDA